MRATPTEPTATPTAPTATQTAPTATRTAHATAPTRTDDRRRRRRYGRLSSALARCVEPIDPGAFLAEYWEKQPLAVPRAEEGRFDDLLSVADVERLISSGGLRSPASAWSRQAGTSRSRLHDRSLLEAEAVHRAARRRPDRRALRRRRDDRPQGLHHTWPPLARFCRALEAGARHPASRRTRTTRRAARRASPCTTTPTMSSCSRSRARSTGGCTTRSWSCR